MSKVETIPLFINLDDKQSLLDKTNCVIIHSGNILYELLQTSEEICKSFCGVVTRWLKAQSIPGRDQLFGHTLSISSLGDTGETIQNRDELKITVKLFLQGYYPEVIDDAIMHVINDLECERLDTVMLSFPPTSDCQMQTFRSIKYNDIEDIWTKLQTLVNNGIISNLGVCDFDAGSLKDLYESSQIKPVINQITLEHCCTPPTELVSCAMSYNVELLTHNDPRDILPANLLKNVLPENNENNSWKALYLMKYSSILKYREVIKSKGYILCMKKDDKK